MQLLNSLILNVILIIFPLLLYLFYMIYNTNLDRKKNEFLFDIVLLTSLYLILKFGSNGTDIPLILFNAPLIIAYANKRNISIMILSFLICSYYITFLNANAILIIVEYILYYILYLVLNRKEFKWHLYIDYFIILKSLFMSTLVFSKSYLISNDVNAFIMIFVLVATLYFTTYFAIDLFTKGKRMIRLHMNLKELEHEKQIKTSLFKITHEIKNPIAVCKGYLDMFDVDNLEHSHKYIPIIKDEISRVLVLLQDFLSISKVKLDCDIMDVNMMLEEVMLSLEPLLNVKNIKFIKDIIDDEVYINGDYHRLSQVIINLIKNSIEASKDEQSYIRVKTQTKDNYYYISIEDNGIGIAKENLKHISDLFYTTKVNGTGLGVSLSKEIVKAHGGTINYYSVEDQGTTVEIKLPLLKEN